MHDGGREDGHNDDAINDSRGSGNMVVMGETHDARPEHMPGVPGVPWKTNHEPCPTQRQKRKKKKVDQLPKSYRK